MCSPAAGSKILYRNSRLLRMAFLQLHRQQRADVFCDVVLQAEGEAVPAHCCILSACSPFFMERLERQVPSQGCKAVLELRGLKIGTLRKLVDFLYTSEMEVSREEALEVLAAARQFQVAELESLQLEGGKLVKQVLGRRLNRQCLQPPPTLISTGVAPRACPPAPTAPRTFCPLVTGKQRAAQPLGDGGVRAGSTPSPAESAKHGVATVAPNGGAQARTQSADASLQPAETGNRRSPSHAQGLGQSLGVRSALGKAEGAQGVRSAEQASPSQGSSPHGSPLPRKIKLSRPKLQPLPKASAPKTPAPCAASSKIPTSSRRLWRQKIPGGDAACGPEPANPSHQPRSPPGPPKTSSRKRSSSTSASGSDPALEEGPVGRVKLRKVVNGSCWEVVQDPPAREPVAALVTTGLTGTSCGTAPPSSCRLEPQAAGSMELPAGRREVAQLPEQVVAGQGPSEGRGGCREPYELDVVVLEPLSESEEFGDSAPLERMLDMLLGSGVEGLGPAGPGAGGGPGADTSHRAEATPAGAAGPGEAKWCSPEVQLWPEWDETGKDPLPGWEVGDGHSAFSVQGDPQEQAGGGHLTARRAVSGGALPISGSPVPLASSPSPQLPSPAAGGREAHPGLLLHLPADQGRGTGLGPCTTLPPGLETKARFQGPRGPPPNPSQGESLASPEGDEIDIMAGAEEGLLLPGITCVRPDPSSDSDEEVDVLN
ncbi:BTB/POZ domain-containing protein 18 [Carettochelys insculpta]|uniref:BTB/POZ domain-containing protein 18 n=1 Tax=Carettochelys insculpta TaxID=44489 RepID=UPI003EBF7F7A